MQNGTIVLADLDGAAEERLAESFRRLGWVVLTCAKEADLPEMASAHREAAVVIALPADRPAPDEPILRLRRECPELPVLAVTEKDTPDETVRALADDWVSADSADGIVPRLRRLLAIRDLARDHRRRRRLIDLLDPPDDPVGRSESFRMALTRAKEAAREGAHLVLCGEPGSGKRTLARWVHRLCGGLPDTFLVADDPEDRVAIRRRIRPLRKWAERPGSSRQPAPYAVSHTLYVAGLERLSARRMEPWVKALHDMFEEEPGGAVRIATAICCDPTRCADLGERIAPLTAYFGGSVMRIDVPPLRERMEDIPFLVEHFRRGRAGGGGFHGPVFSEEAMDALRRYPWPGNVRELELLVARARMAGSGDPVTTEDVSRWLESPDERAGVLPLREAVRAFEHRQIESALRRTGDNKVEAARMLGIGLSSLYRKLDEWKRDHAGFS